MSDILHALGAAVVTVGLFIGSLFGYQPEPHIEYVETEALGADTVLPISGQTYTLAGSGISSSATSFVLTSFTIPQNGKKIQDSEMSDTFYITFEPGSRARQEIASCTTVVQNADGTASFSGCVRGLSPVTPYTASTSLQFAHNGGSSVIFSNASPFYNDFAAKANDETITGQWTFTTFPITASTSIASATTSGIAELATGGEAASSTISGDIATSKLVLHTGIATSAAPASGNVVVVTGDDGNIDGNFIDTLPGTTTVTGTSTGNSRVEIITSSSTWSKPSHAKYIEVYAIGGGGGGAGAGIDNAAPKAENGGAGGGGGGISFMRFNAGALPSTVTVTIGGGGVGGAGRSAGSNGAGQNGADGVSTSFGSYLIAYGGTGGQAQTSGLGSGPGGTGSLHTGTGGGHVGAEGANASTTLTAFGPTGGGGGSLGQGNSGTRGGNQTTFSSFNGGTPGGGTGANATSSFMGGLGGGGGFTGTDSGAGNGGAGGTYGGGGGGGGASDNTSFAGGTGGNGGRGAVIVVIY